MKPERTICYSADHLGVPLHDQRSGWEVKRVADIFDGKTPGILVVPQDTEQFLKSLTRLTDPDSEESPVDARFDQEGFIYTTRWSELPTELDNHGRRCLPPPAEDSDYTILHPRNIDLDNLPPETPIVGLFPVRVDDIYTAIRQQKHILNQYGRAVESEEGPELAQARAILEFTEKQVSRILNTRTLSAADLSKLYQETDQMISSSGLDRARDPVKREIRDQLRAAATRIDGHPNYLITFSHLGAAHTRALALRAVAHKTTDKFQRNLEALEYHRDISVQSIQMAVIQLELVEAQLSSDPEKVTPEIIENIASLVSIPQVRPFLCDTRWVSLRLVSAKDAQRDQNNQIFGAVTANRLAQNPLIELLRAYQLEPAQLVISGCLDHLNYALRYEEPIDDVAA